MLTESMSVPFTFTDLYGGFAEGTGIARLDPAGLILEFEVKEALFGLLKSDVRQVMIPTTEMASIDLAKGWLRTKIIVRTNSLRTASEVPGSQGAEIVLCVARKHRALAQELVSTLNLTLCAHHLKQMEDS